MCEVDDHIDDEIRKAVLIREVQDEIARVMKGLDPSTRDHSADAVLRALNYYDCAPVPEEKNG